MRCGGFREGELKFRGRVGGLLGFGSVEGIVC